MTNNILIDSFYQEWFDNPLWWFNASPSDDKYISEKYSELINLDSPKPENINNYKLIIKWILIYDQLPRHVYRHRKQYANHIITYYLQKAIEITKQTLKFVDGPYSSYKIMSIREHCFMLMPYRHTYDPQYIFLVMPRIWSLIQRNDISNFDLNLLKRYLKATYERCPLDQSYWVQNINYGNNIEIQSIIKEILEFKPILGYCPTNIIPYSNDIYNEELVKHIYDIFENINSNNIIVSLSGGVDSMCLSVCVCLLYSKFTNRNINIHLVHVNYTNRSTAYEEEAFVRSWAKYLNLPCHIRRISEIKRANAMKFELRELYESYTRNVRYNTYKYVWYDQMNMPKNTLPLVMLGHNKDDCFENILTNIVNQSKYDELQGMQLEGIQDNIRFIRPMLKIYKSKLHEFAKKYGIPHLPNSTPSWHSRGKIRENVKPVLLDWDSKSVDSFFSMSDIMKDMYNIMNTYVDTIINNIEYIDNNYYMKFMKSNIPSSPLMWRSLIYKLTNTIVSIKSLKNLEQRLSKYKNEGKYYGKVQLTSTLQLDISMSYKDDMIIMKL